MGPAKVLPPADRRGSGWIEGRWPRLRFFDPHPTLPSNRLSIFGTIMSAKPQNSLSSHIRGERERRRIAAPRVRGSMSMRSCAFNAEARCFLFGTLTFDPLPRVVRERDLEALRALFQKSTVCEGRGLLLLKRRGLLLRNWMSSSHRLQIAEQILAERYGGDGCRVGAQGADPQSGDARAARSRAFDFRGREAALRADDRHYRGRGLWECSI
jgi:hypothetical protein